MKLLSVTSLHLSSLLVLVVITTSCGDPNNLQIVIANDASKLELWTAEDLKEDIEKVTDLRISIVQEQQTSKGKKIYLGTTSSNDKMNQLLAEDEVILTGGSPGPRGGLWHNVDHTTIVIAGSDVQGLQYAVYDYSKEVLELDPLIYWTGHKVNRIADTKLFEFENRRIEPPAVPLLVYFENDVDELANLKNPLLEYDWTSYTEMIDALIRMRYNGIHFFDMLGRAEFFQRAEYKKIRPNYQVDVQYLDSMITYAQDKGMKVQIDMALGYQMKPLDSKYADCWKEHKSKWVDTWKYYLENTPIGKADIFSMRPRNQVWDWKYKSTCGEDKVDVFNEAFAVFDSLVESFNPEATKVLVAYHDGMEMFNNGFAPPGDWIVAWSDDGYGGFDYLPDDTKGFDFGTYMHAGFWKNHTVADPYPERVDTIMHMMFETYDATAYCQVNGQQFRPFLFNLEAYSEVCRDPETFTGDGFYQYWAERYFERDSLQQEAIAVMKSWHRASFGKGGYVQNLWEIREAIAYLSMKPIERPGRNNVAYSAGRVENDLTDTNDRMVMMKGAAYLAGQLLPKASDSYFFYDQVYFPIQLYKALLEFEKSLHQLYRIKRNYEAEGSENAKKQAVTMMKSVRLQLEKIYNMRDKGDQNPRWKGWYDVAHRRPNNGFPTFEMLDDIEEAIANKW